MPVRTRRGDRGPRRRVFTIKGQIAPENNPFVPDPEMRKRMSEFFEGTPVYVEGTPNVDPLEAFNSALRIVEDEIGTSSMAETGEIEWEYWNGERYVYTMTEDDIAKFGVVAPGYKAVQASGSILVPDEKGRWWDFQAALTRQKNGKWVGSGEAALAEELE